MYIQSDIEETMNLKEQKITFITLLLSPQSPFFVLFSWTPLIIGKLHGSDLPPPSPRTHSIRLSWLVVNGRGTCAADPEKLVGFSLWHFD